MIFESELQIEDPEIPFLITHENNCDLSASDLKVGLDNTIHQLLGNNVAPGDSIAIQLDAGMKMVIYYLTAVRLGLRTTILPTDETQKHLRIKQRDVQFETLVSDRNLEDLEVSKLEPLDNPSLFQDHSRNQTMDNSNQHELIVYTSGTSGKPKGVPLTWEQLKHHSEESIERLNLSPGDMWLSPLPVHHIGGLAPIVRCLQSGSALCLESYSTDRLLSIFENHEVSHLSLVPTMLRDLLNRVQDWNRSSLEVVLVGGAKIPEELRVRSIENEIPIFPSYGMTETTSHVTLCPPEESNDSETLVGKPLSIFDVTITDSDDEILPDGESGEITIDGKTVTDGYLNRGTLNQNRFCKFGLKTGDLGYFNEKGRLHVIGREDRRINTGAESVYPSAVEMVLEQHSNVREVSVVGIPDDRLGERICALIVPDRSSDFQRKEFSAWLDRRVDSIKRPHELKVRDTMPHTSSGTPDLETIRNIFQETG